MALGLLISPPAARGHALGENYVFFNFRKFITEGIFQIHFNELREQFDLDIPSDLDAARAVVQESADTVQAYILENFQIGPVDGDPFEIKFLRQDVIGAVGGFAEYHFEIKPGPLPDQLRVRDTKFLDGDRDHRALLLVQYNDKTRMNHGGEYTALVFSPANTEQTLNLVTLPGLLTEPQMKAEGFRHSLFGPYHSLFLLVVLLAAVLRRGDAGWEQSLSAIACCVKWLVLTTLFLSTLSATFWLSIHDKLYMGGGFAGLAMFLSVVVIALKNLRPHGFAGTLLLTFFFGCFHGIGLARAMEFLAFRMVDLAAMAEAYYWGFARGAAAVSLGIFVILFLLRRRAFYIPIALRGGSLLAILASLAWLGWQLFGRP